MISKALSVTRSRLLETMVYLDGKRMSFDDYPYQRGIYDCPGDKVVLKTCRQVGKTVYDANLVVSDSVLIRFFKSLYVSPTKDQTSRFSITRLSKILSYSPALRDRFLDTIDNIFMKTFTTGAEIVLSYACDDADRIRSITADRILLDEAQDMDLVNILPIIKEVSANSEYAYETYTGTPKSMENGLEWLWQMSTQAEWIMKCSGCNRWNYVDSIKSIGKTGPICVKCGKALNPRDGMWYEVNPNTKDNLVRLKGFHVSQLILPRNVESPKRWDRIIEKLENYPEYKFRNEVLGVSDSVASRMVSRSDLEAMCEEYTVDDGSLNFRKQSSFICAGVDWSGGGTKLTSRTVLWIWGLGADDKVKTIMFKIFPGHNQVDDVREVAKLCQMYNVQLVCGDAGEGAVANSMLREILGDHRVYQVQYGSNKKFIAWNGVDRWMVDRTAMIDSFMLLLKRGGAVFPTVLQSTPAFDDVLALYEETTQNGIGKKVWRHSPSMPDDSLHAMVFGWLALRLIRGEFKMY